MALRDLIQSLGLTGTAADVTMALNAKTVQHLNTDLITSTGVLLALGQADASVAIAGLEAAMAGSALLRSQYQKLNSTGLDFSDQVCQTMIDSITASGAWSSDIGTKLKGLGIQMISPYEAWAGVGQTALDPDVAAALIAPTITGQSISVSVNVQPSSNSVALSVTAMAGDQPCGIVSCFSASSATDARLTASQQAFVATIFALVQSYGK